MKGLLLLIIICLSYASKTSDRTVNSGVNLLEVLHRSTRFNNLEIENFLEDVATRVSKNEIEYEQFGGRFEIDFEKLIAVKRNNSLGDGYFGVVEKYELKHVNVTHPHLTVAVKKAKRKEEKEILLFKEIIIMCSIPKHANILALVGAVTKNCQGTLLVTELAHGDLKKFLDAKHYYIFKNLIIRDETEIKTGRYNMDSFEISESLTQLSTFDLISFAYQIANGMKHLASVPCVHRDLALRNILITSNKTIRIGDFGLARKSEDSGEYYLQQTDQALPTPRMAPESLTEGTRHYNKYSEKSDVWPFALCLYELFTLGRSLKDNAPGNLQSCLLEKNWLPEPENCLSETFQFMKFCWEKNPGNRPSFSLCKHVFEQELKKFPNQAFGYLTRKLANENKNQRALESWVRNEYSEPPVILPIEPGSFPLNPINSNNKIVGMEAE